MGIQFHPHDEQGNPSPTPITLMVSTNLSDRYELTLMDLLDRCAAQDLTIESRRCLGFNMVASAGDLQSDQVGVYTALLTEADRDPAWPPLDADIATFDAIFDACTP